MCNEKKEAQRCLAKLLDELGKTLRINRTESDAYAKLEDAYEEDVEVYKLSYTEAV